MLNIDLELFDLWLLFLDIIFHLSNGFFIDLLVLFGQGLCLEF